MQRNKRTKTSRVAKRSVTRATPVRAASTSIQSLQAPSKAVQTVNTSRRAVKVRNASSSVITVSSRSEATVATKRTFTNVFSETPTPAWKGPVSDLSLVPKIAPYSDADTIIKAVDNFHKSVAMPIEHSPLGGLGQLIKENGTLKFMTFLGIGLASKEIYQIDAGSLNLFNTSIVLFSYYIAAKGAVDKSFHEYRTEMINRYQDALKAKDAILGAGIRHCEALLGKPDVVRDVNKAYQEAHDALTVANVRREQQKHKEAIEAKLSALHFAEQTAIRAKAEATKNAALDYIRANALTDKIKADVLKEALTLVGVQDGNKGNNFRSLQALYKDAMKQA